VDNESEGWEGRGIGRFDLPQRTDASEEKT
jgi:hypothetical protein